VNIDVLYAISVFKRSVLSKFSGNFPLWLCTGYAHGHLINFAYLLDAERSVSQYTAVNAPQRQSFSDANLALQVMAVFNARD